MDYLKTASYIYTKNRKNIQIVDAPSHLSNDFKLLGGRYYVKKNMWSFSASILEQDHQEHKDDEIDKIEEQKDYVENAQPGYEEYDDDDYEENENYDDENEDENDDNEDYDEDENEDYDDENEDDNEDYDDENEDDNEDYDDEKLGEIGVVDVEDHADDKNLMVIDLDDNEYQYNSNTDYDNNSMVIDLDDNNECQYNNTLHTDYDYDNSSMIIDLDNDNEYQYDNSSMVIDLEHTTESDSMAIDLVEPIDHHVINIDQNDENNQNYNKEKNMAYIITETHRISRQDVLHLNKNIRPSISNNKYKIYPSNEFYEIINDYKKLLQVKEK